jgi:hypothetical protein
MKLVRATFLAISGLPDITCEFADPQTGGPRDVVVLTGPPHSGKTRAMEAILFAKEVLGSYVSAPEDGEGWIREGADTAKIELTFAIDAYEQSCYGIEAEVFAEALLAPDSCAAEVDEGLVALLADYEHGSRTGKLEYFAATRALPPHASGGFKEEDQARHRTSSGPNKYAFIKSWLASLGKDAGAARRFQHHLERLCPRLSYRPSSGADPTRCILRARDGALATPSELSSTEADAVLFAATAALVWFERSILFVDRPELSADEATFSAWLAAARGLAEDAQLIFASSSPAVIASVDPAAVLRLG